MCTVPCQPSVHLAAIDGEGKHYCQAHEGPPFTLLLSGLRGNHCATGAAPVWAHKDGCSGTRWGALHSWHWDCWQIWHLGFGERTWKAFFFISAPALPVNFPNRGAEAGLFQNSCQETAAGSERTPRLQPHIPREPRDVCVCMLLPYLGTCRQFEHFPQPPAPVRQHSFSIHLDTL